MSCGTDKQLLRVEARVCGIDGTSAFVSAFVDAFVECVRGCLFIFVFVFIFVLGYSCRVVVLRAERCTYNRTALCSNSSSTGRVKRVTSLTVSKYSQNELLTSVLFQPVWFRVSHLVGCVNGNAVKINVALTTIGSMSDDASDPPSGYLTRDGDFFLGHVGQDCSSVCFAAGRSCSTDLSNVGGDVFVALGLDCKDLPPQLSSATSSRYRFPGWISATENLYYGSCFNVDGVSGDTECTDLWESGSRVCKCPDESKPKTVDYLKASGTIEMVIALVLIGYIVFSLCKRCCGSNGSCFQPTEAKFASIKDSFNEDDADSCGDLDAYHSDDEDSQGLLSNSPRHDSHV